MAAELVPYNNNQDVVIYRTEDGTVQLDVQLSDETVWLTQQQMADLFASSRTNIVEHIQHIYADYELTEDATCRIFRQVRKEGKRMVTRNIPCYNLDLIISVGYRVNSIRGVKFRQWANKVLKQYLLNGYAVNQQLIALQHQLDSRFALQDSRLNVIENQLSDHQEKIDFFVRTALPPAEKVFFGGEFFDARVALEQIIRTAKQRVIIIDAYVDATTFEMLDVRDKGVSATIYSGKDLTNLRDMHNVQPDVEPIDTFIWTNPSHDRWLIVDDIVYHCGHSLKDMGRKMSAISQMGISAEKILNEVR